MKIILNKIELINACLLLVMLLFISGCSAVMKSPPQTFEELKPQPSQLEEKSVWGLTGLRLGTQKKEVERIFSELGLVPLKETVDHVTFSSDDLIYKKLPRNPLALRYNEVVLMFDIKTTMLIGIFIRICSTLEQIKLFTVVDDRADKFNYYLLDTGLRLNWLLGDLADKGEKKFHDKNGNVFSRITYNRTLGNEHEHVRLRIDKNIRASFLTVVIDIFDIDLL